MKYEIIYGGNLHALHSAVNLKISQGWEPQGGIAVVPKGTLSTPFNATLLQAMIKR